MTMPLLPASEGFIVPGEAAELVRPLLPEDELATLFDLMPDVALAVTNSHRVQDSHGAAGDAGRDPTSSRP